MPVGFEQRTAGAARMIAAVRATSPLCDISRQAARAELSLAGVVKSGDAACFSVFGARFALSRSHLIERVLRTQLFRAKKVRAAVSASFPELLVPFSGYAHNTSFTTAHDAAARGRRQPTIDVPSIPSIARRRSAIFGATCVS